VKVTKKARPTVNNTTYGDRLALWIVAGMPAQVLWLLVVIFAGESLAPVYTSVSSAYSWWPMEGLIGLGVLDMIWHRLSGDALLERVHRVLSRSSRLVRYAESSEEFERWRQDDPGTYLIYVVMAWVGDAKITGVVVKAFSYVVFGAAVVFAAGGGVVVLTFLFFGAAGVMSWALGCGFGVACLLVVIWLLWPGQSK